MRVCSNLWLVFFLSWMLAALRTKRTVERVNWRRGLYYGLPVVLGFYLMFSKNIDVSWLNRRILPHSQELAIAAIVVTVAGLLFAVWARVCLGRNWSSAPTIKEQHQLIRTGPYRFCAASHLFGNPAGDGGYVPGKCKSAWGLGSGAGLVRVDGKDENGRAVHGPHLRRRVRRVSPHDWSAVTATSRLERFHTRCIGWVEHTFRCALEDRGFALRFSA